MKVDLAASRVRDVMAPIVYSLSRDQSLAEAAKLFADRDISGAPVCDRQRKVLGMLSKTDIAEFVAKNQLDHSVEEAMVREVHSVHDDDPFSAAVKLMAFEGVHRVVVVDAQGGLVGILTAMDVVREISGYGRRASTRIEAVAPPEK